MDLNKVRRLAMNILNVGETKIWLDPSKEQQIKEAMTKDDVRGLIAERIIRKKQDSFQSKGRTRSLKEKKKKGRKKGQGKRTGTKKARVKKKAKHINAVRAQRRVLKDLKEKEPELFKTVKYSSMYKKIKSGFFKGKKYVESAVREAK